MADKNPIEWSELIESTRWAALGTVDENGGPYVSSVAFATETGVLLIHVSQLAAHTRNLLSRPVFSLLLSESDTGEQVDPQLLARLTISGRAERISQEGADFLLSARTYIAQFPEAEMRFGFGDFHLFRLIPESGNFVGGFGRAARLKGEKIAAALSHPR